VIHALALFASHLFDLAGFWNEVRESLTLAKRRMASRSSRLAPTFVLGDLVSLFSKVYIYIHLCDQCLGLFSIIDKWLDILQA
jgi:hypothetical protein